MKKLNLIIGILCSMWGIAQGQIAVEHDILFNKQKTPAFSIKTEEGYDTIHWQAANDPDFATILCESICQYNSTITLPSLSEKEDEAYYFRLKGQVDKEWQEWTEPIPFYVLQPQQQKIKTSFVEEDLQSIPYQKPTNVDDRMWEELQPYLLPMDHPAKPILDALCVQCRITANLHALVNADFQLIRAHSRKKMVVASHPELKGFLIKTYLDTHNMFKQEGFLWKRRVVGAEVIQSTIDKYGYNHIFKVPKKWIYPLHLQPKAPRLPHIFPKNFLLVVEEMDIYDREASRLRYRTKMTHEILRALYHVVTEDKLFDSLFLDNIPFCKDGRIAFIDTEYYNVSNKKIKYEKLDKYLSSGMKKYWHSLSKKKHK